MFDAILIQFLWGLYFVGVGLPSATAPNPTPPSRKPLSSYVQVIFGVALVVLSALKVSLLGAN